MTFLDFLHEYNVPHKTGGTHARVSNNWLGFDCPKCEPGSSLYHGGYNTVTGALNCWHCGRLGLVDTLRGLANLTYPQARDIATAMGQPYALPVARVPHKLMLPQGLAPLAGPHRQYLRERGFSPARLARLWGLQGIGIAPRLSWRVWIPIHRDGQIVSWTTRSCGARNVKRYVAAAAEQEAYPARSCLYGADYCRHAAIVCEGPTDVWRIGPGAVATMGVAITPAQINLIAAYPVRVICFDNDAAGQARAQALCEAVAGLPGMTVNVKLDAADPGSATAAEILHLRKTYLENGVAVV